MSCHTQDSSYSMNFLAQNANNMPWINNQQVSLPRDLELDEDSKSL